MNLAPFWARRKLTTHLTYLQILTLSLFTKEREALQEGCQDAVKKTLGLIVDFVFEVKCHDGVIPLQRQCSILYFGGGGFKAAARKDPRHNISPSGDKQIDFLCIHFQKYLRSKF